MKTPHLDDFRRIVVKVGSSLLIDSDAGEVRASWLTALAADLAKLHGEGRELLIVSSGSIDGARRYMALQGEEAWGRALDLSCRLRQAVQQIPGMAVLGEEVLARPEVSGLDETKVTIHVQGLGVPGMAVADWLLHGGDLVDKLHEYFHAYPLAGYGGTFIRWAGLRRREPYNSWGNGSAMRVSPIGFAYDMLDEVLLRARWSAEVTHNHPEGIAGGQATAAAVYLARTGSDKDEIRDFIERKFGYDLSTSLDELRPNYRFDVSCRGSVPPAIRAFLESPDYESAVRLAISLGGDCDTIACIAGGIAHAHYRGVPQDIRRQALMRLDERLRAVVEAFEVRYPLD